MEDTALERAQALVVAFESLSSEELPKQKRKLLFCGDVVEATGEATIVYKPIECSDGSTYLRPLMVSWTDNGIDYSINLAGYAND